MKSHFLLAFNLIFLFVLGAQVIKAQSLDSELETIIEANNIPGMAAGIVKNGELIYERYFGMANFETNTPVNEETSFMLASVTKHFTYTACLIAWDQGLIPNFQVPINDILPFEVHHPNSSTAITIAHLLTHTSGIKDNWDEMPYHPSDEESRPLGEYLENYLVPTGDIYYPELNFVAEGIGSNSYSNIGYALAGYVVEVLSGMDYAEFVDTYILDPLCMENSSFFINGLDEANIAMPYDASFNPIGHYSYADYPAGRLRVTLRDMANYTIACVQGGQMDGTEILGPDFSYSILGSVAGGDRGVRTVMGFFEENVAVIFMVNGDSNTNSIMNIMADYADSFISFGPDQLSCNDPVGLEQTNNERSNKKPQFKIYPIPSKEYLRLELVAMKTHDIKEIAIFNTLGEECIKVNRWNGEEIGISPLDEGTYIFRIQDNEGRVSTLPFQKY